MPWQYYVKSPWTIRKCGFRRFTRKAGNLLILSNYHPVSLTLSISTIIENCIPRNLLNLLFYIGGWHCCFIVIHLSVFCPHHRWGLQCYGRLLRPHKCMWQTGHWGLIYNLYLIGTMGDFLEWFRMWQPDPWQSVVITGVTSDQKVVPAMSSISTFFSFNKSANSDLPL